MPWWFWSLPAFWITFYLTASAQRDRWLWPGSKTAKDGRELRRRYDREHKAHMESCYRAMTDGEYKWLMRMGWEPEGEAKRMSYSEYGGSTGTRPDPDAIYLPDGTEVKKGDTSFAMPEMEQDGMTYPLVPVTVRDDDSFDEITRKVREATAHQQGWHKQPVGSVTHGPQCMCEQCKGSRESLRLRAVESGQHDNDCGCPRCEVIRAYGHNLTEVGSFSFSLDSHLKRRR